MADHSSSLSSRTFAVLLIHLGTCVPGSRAVEALSEKTQLIKSSTRASGYTTRSQSLYFQPADPVRITLPLWQAHQEPTQSVRPLAVQYLHWEAEKQELKEREELGRALVGFLGKLLIFKRLA